MGVRRCLVLCATAAVVAPLAVASSPGAGARAAETAAEDPYRPQLHFSPERNWANDPNGPVWYQGRYHLFFQHNPAGSQWGNMSWGHATSTDLLHWEEQPVAIPFSEDEHVFSGSVVVDEGNTSGFGTRENPPLVAVYTSAYPATGVQAQSLAYSTDAGTTWTRYDGNPVLDIGSTEFRDPKVFRYEEGDHWVMAVALAAERRIRFYRSDDLRSWTHLSDFGPAHAVGGVWEMPDLFELPVDGDPDDTRWVLVVNLNPGAVAGGSGAQYFLGDFDGTTFTADGLVDAPPDPEGTVIADFEGGEWPAGWDVTGTAFGDVPAAGTLPGQQEVIGARGAGLVNTFVGGDRSQGTLTSPPFTIDRGYLNLLVGGGHHPARPGTGDGSPPPGEVLADFESGDFGDWTVTGDAFGAGPEDGDAPCQEGVTGYLGTRLASSYHSGAAGCDVPPDAGTGSLTSPEFTISRDHIAFLVGGGAHDEAAVRLLVDGEVVRSTAGSESGALDWASWDVRDLAGRTARIEVRDAHTGGWGHVMVDHVVLADEPARPRSTEATVGLVVDGETVRTATGRDSEALDWVAWDVRDLVGRTARLRVVDGATGGWGHLLVDQVVASDEPALRELEHYRWVDHGKDFYAALTVENHPDGERVAIAWMNNWQYAAQTPTGDWRGAMSAPRRLALRTVDGEVRLTQELLSTAVLHAPRPTFTVRDQRVAGVVPLPARADGNLLEIRAEIAVGDAEEVGLHVRAGDGERTVVGYDVARERLLVDRTASGDVGFHPDFASDVQEAPLAAHDGVVTLRVLVDRSSVEVLGGRGEVAITDLVYPSPDSRGVVVYAEGGEATLRSLTVRPLRSAR